MDPDVTVSLAAAAGLVLLAGCVLDVILRPLPLLAPPAQRRRRRLFWTGLVVLYVAVMLAL